MGRIRRWFVAAEVAHSLSKAILWSINDDGCIVSAHTNTHTYTHIYLHYKPILILSLWMNSEDNINITSELCLISFMKSRSYMVPPSMFFSMWNESQPTPKWMRYAIVAVLPEALQARGGWEWTPIYVH